MDSEELLAQLRDIHLPEPVSWWPPAPGWWVLALLLLAAVIYGFIQYRKYWQRQQICMHALDELEAEYRQFAASAGTAQDQLDYINGANAVLRRVALVHFPQANVASLGGSEWVDFIRKNGESSGLTDDIAAALSHGRFQTHCEVDVEAAQQFGRQWIRSLYLDRQPAPSEDLNKDLESHA